MRCRDATPPDSRGRRYTVGPIGAGLRVGLIQAFREVDLDTVNAEGSRVDYASREPRAGHQK